MIYDRSGKKDSGVKRTKRSKKSEERQTKQDRVVIIRSLDILYIEKLQNLIVESNTIVQTTLGPIRLL